MTKNEQFERDGYLFVPQLIEDSLKLKVSVPTERGTLRYQNHQFVLTDEEQVPGSLSRYNIPDYKELHFNVKKKIEKILGINLYPTYYFDRFYFAGQQLTRHIDRPACEISVTLQISSNNKNNPWHIWFQKPDGTEASVAMKDGDAVIYKGCEREHWRYPLSSKYTKFQQLWRNYKKLSDDTYHHQIFLHYVAADGYNVQYAFDATPY